VKRGDRVGLVGANGAGKSTLLSILTGKVARDGGIVHMAPGVKGAVFSQEQDDLRPDRTVRAEILEYRPTLREEDVKALAGRFRFDPETDLGRTVSTLSGGERQRLKLLKCILKPSNLLILDEPTNHLDLWARDVVVKALNSYPGTLVVVSHDRYLLDSVTDTTAVLDAGRIHQYPGSFSETRALHRRRAPGRRGTTYVVRKKFADWAQNRKYAAGEELTLTEEQVATSMTIRNAIQQGWLEPKES
jgi:ATP-binding cassette, subfamily F, member 3